MHWLKPFCAALVLTVALDFIWLGFVMKKFNLEQLKGIGRIQDGQFDVWMPPAIITYLLMTTLIVVFVLPLTAGKPVLHVFGAGCLMGFCVYGIFDLTNAAILKDYPLPFAAVDMAWGTVLFGLVSLAASRFLPG